MKLSPIEKFFHGHPPGLPTLFFTEMWERMSYYGMRALLVLFMTTAMQSGGLELSPETATAIYGLYTGMVYFMGLPGGWIADRLIGSQRAVWYGGVIIMCGHIVLAIPNDKTFFIGLILVVLGTGLLKPNISALVGSIYSRNDSRKDSGYTLYYMGINLGSILGATVCGFLGENVGWHWGFGAAAIGMAAGLVHFRLTLQNLNGVGLEPVKKLSPNIQKVSWSIISIFLLTLSIITFLMLNRYLVFDPRTIAKYTAFIILVIFLVFYALIFFLGRLNSNEKKCLGALFLICVASACFWSGFEQAGSSLNLFSKDYTDRMIWKFEIPASWFQNINAFFILTLSPFFAALWIKLSQRMIDPSYGIKCAIGLIIMASGFIVMYFAAHVAASGLKAAPYFLVMTYFLHTVGELCLSPVALSAVSKLSPKRFAGQLFGAFILTYSIGSIIAGILAGHYDPEKVEEMPGLFIQISLFSIAIGIVIFLFSLKTRHWEKYANTDET